VIRARLGCALVGWMLWVLGGPLSVEAAKKTPAAAGDGPARPVAPASGPGSGPGMAPGLGGMPGGARGGTSGAVVLKAERQRPEDIPDPWRWVPLGGVVLACAAAGTLAAVWWRRRGAPEAPALPPPDPSMLARERILRAREGMGDVRWYVAEVSDAVRFYLEARHGLRAPEQTTEEFLAGLAGRELPGIGDAGGLGEFLGWCDLVKFAGWKPGGSELEGLEGAALGMVERTAAGSAAGGGA